MANHNSVLKAAIERFALLRFARGRIEEQGESLIGVPVAIGKQWVVLARMDDAIRFDGFDALRLEDLTMVDRTFPRRSFYLGALGAKRCRMASIPGLDLTNARTLLESVKTWYSLVVVDREVGEWDGADIGRVLRFSSKSFTLQLLSPDAEWDRDPQRIDLADVTRVGFGGEYEETLAAVAGMRDPRWP
jgi:hypothetical protein